VEKQNNYFEQDILIKKINKIDLSSGVGNSEFCLQKVHDEISRSRRTLQPVTLLLISLDNYYDLRLRHSNVAISYFIRSIADFLVAKSRVNDVVGRWKDDEFILCLPHTNLRGAAIKAEKLRRFIEALDFSQIFGAATIITTSIGVSEYPKHCRDAQELIDRAEIALIEVKKQGKNKILLSAARPNFEPDFAIHER
ncbi:MAG: GGDEF domain-containing protein, partial [Bdellovibrionales bacterium]